MSTGIGLNIETYLEEEEKNRLCVNKEKWKTTLYDHQLPLARTKRRCGVCVHRKKNYTQKCSQCPNAWMYLQNGGTLISNILTNFKHFYKFQTFWQFSNILTNFKHFDIFQTFLQMGFLPLHLFCATPVLRTGEPPETQAKILWHTGSTQRNALCLQLFVFHNNKLHAMCVCRSRVRSQPMWPLQIVTRTKNLRRT